MPLFAEDREGVRLSFDAEEAELLRDLASQLTTLLRDGTPDDTVMGRLMPPAYMDPVEEAEYKELIGDTLRTEKLQALHAVREALGKRGKAVVTLARDDLDTWLPALTDIRLALGVRLDVDEQAMTQDLDPNDPNAFPLSVIHWLGWITEELIRRTTV